MKSKDFFGDDADKLFKLLLLAIDRTGHGGNALDVFIQLYRKV